MFLKLYSHTYFIIVAKYKQPLYYLILILKSVYLKNTYFHLMLNNINEIIVLKYLYVFLMHSGIYI